MGTKTTYSLLVQQITHRNDAIKEIFRIKLKDSEIIEHIDGRYVLGLVDKKIGFKKLYDFTINEDENAWRSNIECREYFRFEIEKRVKKLEKIDRGCKMWTKKIFTMRTKIEIKDNTDDTFRWKHREEITRQHAMGNFNAGIGGHWIKEGTKIK